MEETELLREVRSIHSFVRQTWLMVLVLVVVIVVPTALVGCLTAAMILAEFLPH